MRLNHTAQLYSSLHIKVENKDIVKIIAGDAATILCLKANSEDEDFILPYIIVFRTRSPKDEELLMPFLNHTLKKANLQASRLITSTVVSLVLTLRSL